jgi:hypothetical protein
VKTKLIPALKRLVEPATLGCGEDGLSSFDYIRYRRHDETVFMWAFDLIELDGDDLRLNPLETSARTCA